MTRLVVHERPLLDDAGVRVSLPVTGLDWATLGAGTNWCMGHGGHLIPHCAIGHTITSTATGTYHFYIAPKKPAVERIWTVTMRGSTDTGVTATDIKVNGTAVVPGSVSLTGSRGAQGAAYRFRESLAAKTNTAADVTFALTASGGNVIVESISCFEQTRVVLDADTDDYGVDLTTLRSRAPIIDLANESLAGVVDAYENLDARRSGYFGWSTDTGSALAVTAGSGSPLTLFELSVPLAGAIATLGDTTTDVTCAVYCKVNAGTGTIRFQSDDAGDGVNVTQTGTSYSWVTGTLGVNCESMTVADGRRGSTWEGVAIDSWVTATNQLDIQAISIVRTTTPI